MKRLIIISVLLSLSYCKQRIVKDNHFFDIGEANQTNLTRQQKCEYVTGGIFKNESCQTGRKIYRKCKSDETKIWLAKKEKCFPKKVWEMQEACMELAKEGESVKWNYPRCDRQEKLEGENNEDSNDGY